MAYGRNNKDSDSNSSWKADRWLNLSVPVEDGSVRLVGVPLRLSDPNQAQVIELLDANPDKATDFVRQLVATYNDGAKTARKLAISL